MSRKPNAKNDAAFTKKEMPFEQWVRGGAHYQSPEEVVYDPDNAPERLDSVDHAYYYLLQYGETQNNDNDNYRSVEDGKFEWISDERRPMSGYCPESVELVDEFSIDATHFSGG